MDTATVRKFLPYLSEENAALVAGLCDGKIKIDPYEDDARFPRTSAWCRQCYNPPSNNELTMAALDDLLEGNGVECIRHPDDSDNIIASYVNMGDTYDGTIVLDEESGDFVLTTWGDWYEGWIEEQNAENDTIQCGWCSHLTPCTYDEDKGQSWHDVLCEQCGNYVDGSPGKTKKKARKGNQ